MLQPPKAGAAGLVRLSRRLRPELLALHQTSMDVGTTASVTQDVSPHLRPQLLALHQTSMDDLSAALLAHAVDSFS